MIFADKKLCTLVLSRLYDKYKIQNTKKKMKMKRSIFNLQEKIFICHKQQQQCLEKTRNFEHQFFISTTKMSKATMKFNKHNCYAVYLHVGLLPVQKLKLRNSKKKDNTLYKGLLLVST